MNVWSTLALEFLKTGLFSVGGGLATLPFLYHMAHRYGWFSTEELANMIAVSESTPGPIGINMATYAGFSAAGIGGALLATICLVIPSIVTIVAISKFLDQFRGNRTVSEVFYGLRPAVTGLIAAAGIHVAAISLLNLNTVSDATILQFFSWPSMALFAVLFSLAMKTKWHPIAIIGLGALSGIVLGL